VFVKGVSSVPAIALLSACAGNAEITDAGAGGTDSSGGTGGTGVGSGGTDLGGSGGTGPGACTLYPAQTEGPFFLDLALVREDITEGKPGAPMTLIIEVLSASSCGPVADAVVDVWHCDADGVYSGFAGQLGGLDTTGQQFLRGALTTDASGIVVFQTIYPGWYPGRTTHIHFKVRPTPTTEATSQLYFPEDATAAVYQSAPYDARGPKDTSNIADSIGRNTPVAIVSQTDDGYEARLTVTIP